MQRNTSSFLILILFFSVLLFVPLYWTVRGESPAALSWLEGRQLAGFDSLGHRGFVSGLTDVMTGDFDQGLLVIREQFIKRAFQQDLETVLSDQFPFRQAFIKTAKAVDRTLIRLAYGLTSDPAIPADRLSDIYINRKPAALLARPEPYRQAYLEVIDQRILNYQALMDQHPETNFYVYYIERIQNVAAHPLDAFFDNRERGRYYDYFLRHRPEGLGVAKLDILSVEDHLAYFYRTDHHWNMTGVCHAYDEIINLLAQDYAHMPEPLPCKGFLTEKFITFRGSLARRTFSPISEPFTIVDYDLPPHEVYENGQPITYSNSAAYLAGTYPEDPYYNHYEGEFGRDYALVEFVFPANPDRSLLVIGNSYDNALVPLLAAHYRQTYNVDLRYYRDFSLSAFLTTHPVEDILVVGENSIVFGSENYLIQP